MTTSHQANAVAVQHCGGVKPSGVRDADANRWIVEGQGETLGAQNGIRRDANEYDLQVDDHRVRVPLVDGRARSRKKPN